MNKDQRLILAQALITEAVVTTDIEESRSANLDPLNPDTDGDGLNDAEDDETINPDAESNVYEIDYLFGDTDQELHFQVKKLDYYLSMLDPNNNFETDNMFYSDKNFDEDKWLVNL